MKNKILEWLQLDDFVENGRKYIDAKITLVKLEIHQLLSHVIAALILIFTLLFLGFMTLGFLSIGLGAFLNHIFESEFLGYLVMGLFFILLIVITLLNQKKLKNYLQELSSKILLQNLNNRKKTELDE